MTPDAADAPGVVMSVAGLPQAGPARRVEALAAGSPPVAFLVDYDGTIAITDVSDTVMA